MDLSSRQQYLIGAVLSILVVSALAVTAVKFTEGSVVPGNEDISLAENYTQGATVSQELSASTSVQPDTEYNDGKVTYIYAKSTVVKEDQTVSESDWVQVDDQSFSKQFSRTFSEPGEYGYVVVLAEAEATYDPGTGSWSNYKITRLDESSYFFRVQSAPEPPVPNNSLQAFFDDLLDGILSLITF